LGISQEKLNPNTQGGQELLGHELTHVVQQREGRVQPTKQGKGIAVNDNPTLENEADVMGKRAAGGKAVVVKGTSQTNFVQARTKQDVINDIAQYDEYIKAASVYYNVPVNQIKAIIAVESGGKSEASSGAAFGLMQVTKSTWKYVQKKYSELNAYDFDSYWRNPKVNIMFGTAVFKGKMKTVGVGTDNENFASLAITAYNAGEGTVKKAIENAKNGGSKNPTKDCLKPEFLKPAIEHYGIYSYYLTGRGKKWNKTKTKEEAIQLKYNEISRYPGKVDDYLKLLNNSSGKEEQSKDKKVEVKVSGKSSGNSYIVQKGDTLNELAIKFNTTVEELKAANKSKLRKWGSVEGFNAGEEISIPVKAKKIEASEELIRRYYKKEIDMIELAQATIPLCVSDPVQVIKIFKKLPGMHQDNLAYSISFQSENNTLSRFNKAVLFYLSKQLDLKKTSPANWIKYGKQYYRLISAISGMKEGDQSKKKDNKEVKKDKPSISEQRKELALEAVNNKKDDRQYGWNFGLKAKGEKVDCSYYVREVEATLNSSEARKIKQEKGFLTPAELNKYSTTFSADNFNDPTVKKYSRGTQKMAAIFKKNSFYSTKLSDVREGDYVFTGKGTSKEINTITHIIIITKIEVVEGKKRYWFADSGLEGAKKNKTSKLYEGGGRSVRNKYYLNHNGIVWGKHHFKGVGR
jgi:LysM repeat protein